MYYFPCEQQQGLLVFGILKLYFAGLLVHDLACVQNSETVELWRPPVEKTMR